MCLHVLPKLETPFYVLASVQHLQGPTLKYLLLNMQTSDKKFGQEMLSYMCISLKMLE